MPPIIQKLSHRVEPSRSLSIGDLAEQLLGDRLIEACELTKDHVTIIQDSDRFTFPYDKARPFMMAMLRGRTWRPRGGGDGGPADAARSLPSALDELAAIAANLGIIAHYERIEAGRVNIGLSSCESELHDEEAVAFLADCIHHHLKTLREDARPSTRQAELAESSDVGQAA